MAHTSPPYEDPTQVLKAEFERRRRRNPCYSQRAFARLLGIPSGRLSEILSQRRPLTPALGERIAERLAYSPRKRLTFLHSISRHRTVHSRARKLRSLPPGEEKYQCLSEDIFRAISDWVHYGILNLIKTVDFRSDCRWIGKRLGVPSSEARDALDRLIRLGLVEERDGRLTRTSANLATSHDVPSPAIRRYHDQTLQLARTALEQVSVEARDFSSLTIALSPEQLPAAKEMIRKFRRSLGEFLSQSEPREVYQLSLCLFPLSREAES